MPHNRLPRCISDEDFQALVEEADGCPLRGSRDKAIVLLMGNLGLRGCDVASLTLDDINWGSGVLHVRNSKSISDRAIPLDAETGMAIEGYVLGIRPKNTSSRALFLPAGNESPGEKMGYRQIIGRIGHLAMRAGLRNYCGAHSLRRAVASNMTNNGISIKTIADVLGHESIVTTMGSLSGKGRKERTLPLWEDTSDLLQSRIRAKGIGKTDYLFKGRHVDHLTRSGARARINVVVESTVKVYPELKDKRISAHVFRHSTAVAMLAAGIDIATVAIWLGYEHINTTHRYVVSDIRLKEEALEKVRRDWEVNPRRAYKPSKDVLDFLQSL